MTRSALHSANAANRVHRRWCEDLLARVPVRLPFIRASIERAIAQLDAHEHRPLSASFRERLARYDRLLPLHAPASAKALPRQPSLFAPTPPRRTP